MAFVGRYSAYEGRKTGGWNDKNSVSAAWRIYVTQFEGTPMLTDVTIIFQDLMEEWLAHKHIKRQERVGRFNLTRTIDTPILTHRLSRYTKELTKEASKFAFNFLNNAMTDICEEFDINRVLLANIIAGQIKIAANVNEPKVQSDLMAVLGASSMEEEPPKYQASASKAYPIGPGGKGGKGGKKGYKIKKEGKRYKKGRPY